MANNLFGYCSTGSYGYDPTKAKSMLQAAGAAGMSVRLALAHGPLRAGHPGRQRGRRLPARRRPEGRGPGHRRLGDVRGHVRQRPAGPGEDRPAPPGLGARLLDAQQGFEQFYSLRTPPAGLESSYYKNPQVDALIEKANSARTRTSGAGLLHPREAGLERRALDLPLQPEVTRT